MDFAPFLLILPFLYLLSTTSMVQSSFRCRHPATCGTLVGYAPINATTLSHIQSLFNVEDLRFLLGANNLPLSTPSNYTIQSNQTVRVPIPCMCYNNTGVSNNVPIYTAKKGDWLDKIATTVFSGLLKYQDIVVANGLSYADILDIGQKLWIPLPCSCDEVGGEKVVHYAHVVEKGSSVEAIAQQFGTDSQTLLNINGMTNNSQLIADLPLDVPLRACNSSIGSDSLDYPLLVSNGSYVITANACVKCSCDSANNWTLQCQPSQLQPTKWEMCPPMQCEASGGLHIGNMTSSSTCNRSTCAYAGYNNQTIFTSLTVESSCSRKRKLKLIIGLAVPVAFTVAIIFMVLLFKLRTKLLSSLKSLNFHPTIKNDERVDAFFLQCGSLAPKKFSYSEIKKITNSFYEKLGQGGYGSVYRGELPDGRIVAIKVLRESKGDGQDFVNEVASISRTSHVNIVALLGFCYEGSKRALIYEYMPNGSLDKFIYNQGSPENHQLAIKTLYEIALGIARGLEYLHRGCTTRILHLDIKPQNILLDASFGPKISDFGLAKLCETRDSIVSMTGARGTCGYIAPEVFWRNFGGISYKSDVYSYGMMVLEMIGGRKKVNVEVSYTSEIHFPSWLYKQLEKAEKLNLDRVIAEEEEEMTRKMIIVSLWCIQTFPSNRPSMSRVVEMLQGSLEDLPIPPQDCFTTSSSSSNTSIMQVNPYSSTTHTLFS